MNVSGDTCDLEQVAGDPPAKQAITSAPSPPKIFISYRREDADWPVLWLTDKLAEHFGAGVVFQDRTSIRPGDDFAAKIVAGAEGCSALLAVMGPRWLGPKADGGRRIDDPRDWVRVEIETAISREIRVIPILVHGAAMPLASELPKSLQTLADRQAITLDSASPDIRSLVSVLEDDIRLQEARRHPDTLHPAVNARSTAKRPGRLRPNSLTDTPPRPEPASKLAALG